MFVEFRNTPIGIQRLTLLFKDPLLPEVILGNGSLQGNRLKGSDCLFFFFFGALWGIHSTTVRKINVELCDC